MAVQLSGDPALEIRGKVQALEKFGTIAFTGLGIVVVIGAAALIYTVVSKMVLSGERPIFGLFLAVFILFALLSLTYVFWRESLKDQLHSVESAPRTFPDDSATLLRLGDAAAFEPAQSVTEPTTELLMADGKTRKFADRSVDESL